MVASSSSSSSQPNLKSLLGPILLLLLVFWCLPIPSVKSQEICSADEPHAIFAADNLPNGTVRLYSNLHYWDLELYHYDQEKDNSSSWWTPFAKLFSTSTIQQSFVKSKELNLKAFIDDRNQEERLVSTVYHGLNFSLHDNKTFSHAMVSFSDWQNSNYTYLFETNNASSAATNSTGRVWLWNATSGQLVKSYDITRDQSEKGGNLFITGAVKVYLNESERLFLFMNRELFVNHFDSTKLHPTRDDGKLYHRGNIPHPISASFTIQVSADRIWIVLIHCTHFCLVPWNISGKFFNFDQCANIKSWKSLEPFFFTNGNPYQDKKPFQSYFLSTNVTQLQNGTTYFENEDFNLFSSSPFFDNPKNTETPFWTFISKYRSPILIVIVLLFSVVVLYFTIDRHSASYNLAKKEQEAKKLLEMEGIDAEKAQVIEKVDVVIQVEEVTSAEPSQPEEIESEV